jgi:predicted CXXCH cytochrome family protein
MYTPRPIPWRGAGAWAVFAGALLVASGCGPAPEREAASPAPSAGRASTPARTAAAAPVRLRYIGSDSCASCHRDAYDAWTGSHHQLALLTPDSAESVGAFDAPDLITGGDRTEFRSADRNPAAAMAMADANGEHREFEITYAIGVFPLQQYVVRYAPGLQQIPPLAWDTRDPADGGDRWFHLYAEDPPAPGSTLHWTGDLFNFESQCAECHVTGFEKQFDRSRGTYASRWAEAGVGCEACHGRGSRHVAWAQQAPDAHASDGKAGSRYDQQKGLEVTLDGGEGRWVMDMERGIARREPALAQHLQTESCGRCHARRTAQRDTRRAGSTLLDTHRPALLAPELYFPDGQILDEVYVYGSFRQSRMHEAGVECSDCHDAHSATLRAPGDAVCARCHLPQRFDVTEHHRHPPDAASCLDCHMTERLYMVVDGRRDHSFRVPRPDLSLQLGTPNACNQCHDDQSAQWATRQVNDWYPDGRHTQPHYGQALAAAWAGQPAAAMALADSPDHNAFVRASAVLALRGQVRSEQALQVIDAALAEPDPLLRFAALNALDGLPEQATVPRALGLLSDPVRNVRMEAARLAAPLAEQLPGDLRAAFDRAAAEYAAAQRYNLDREFGYLNLANFLAARNDNAGAARLLRHGLDRYPRSTALRVNLADALRALGQNPQALALLEQTRLDAPDDATTLEALALAYVRAQRYDEAVSTLRHLVAVQPDDPRPAALLVLALERNGDLDQARALLETLRASHPTDGLIQSIRLGSE